MCVKCRCFATPWHGWMYILLRMLTFESNYIISGIMCTTTLCSAKPYCCTATIFEFNEISCYNALIQMMEHCQPTRSASFFLSFCFTLVFVFLQGHFVRKNYSASLFRFSTHPHKCHVTYFTFHCFTFFIQSQWYQIFQSLNESQHHENFLFFVNSNQSTWCHWT